MADLISTLRALNWPLGPWSSGFNSWRPPLERASRTEAPASAATLTHQSFLEGLLVGVVDGTRPPAANESEAARVARATSFFSIGCPVSHSEYLLSPLFTSGCRTRVDTGLES